MDFRFSHEFDIDPQGFWTLFFSEDFAEDMFKRTGMKNRKVLEYKDSGDRIVRTQRVEPDMPVPAWASSVVSSTAYTEYDVYDRAASKMEVRIEPGMMASRFKMSGTFSVTPLGPGRCQRVFSGEVKVSVMLIGGKIEQYMIDEMRKGYDRAAEVTRDWIANRGAPSRAPCQAVGASPPRRAPPARRNAKVVLVTAQRPQREPQRQHRSQHHHASS